MAESFKEDKMTEEDTKRFKKLRAELLGCAAAVDREMRKGDKAMEVSVSKILEKNNIRMKEIQNELEVLIWKDFK